MRSARNILHVLIIRNSDVCAYVRTEDTDGTALDWRPNVCCNGARLSLPGGFNACGHF